VKTENRGIESRFPYRVNETERMNYGSKKQEIKRIHGNAL
jgi:hypothetical protein